MTKVNKEPPKNYYYYYYYYYYKVKYMIIPYTPKSLQKKFTFLFNHIRKKNVGSINKRKKSKRKSSSIS